MPAKIYQVLPVKGVWTVKEVSARCASGKFETKPAAVARARELATQAMGDVLVLKADGSVEREYPYQAPQASAAQAPKAGATAADAPVPKKRAPCGSKKQ
jgi:hypothetical protein